MNVFALPSRILRLAKESSWIIVGQVFSVIGSLVLVRTLTEYLQPAEYGELALGLTLTGLVNQVVMGGIIASAGRYYSVAAEKSDLAGYFAATKSLGAMATSALSGATVVLLFGMYWHNGTKWFGLTVAVMVFAVASSCSALLTNILNAARQRALVASHTCLDPWLKLFFAIGFIFWFGNSSTAVVVGYAASSVLLAGSQYHFIGRVLPTPTGFQPTANTWKHPMQKYAWPFLIWGVFTWAQQASDRWALQHFSGDASVGMYTVLFQLGYVPIGMVTTMAMALISPVLYQRMGSAEDPCRRNSVHRLAWAMTWIGLAATGLAFVVALYLHEWFFKLFVAAGYASVSYLLPWVILAGGLFSAGQVLALKLMSEMRPTAMTAVKVTTAIAGTAMNIWSASYFGIAGVVLSLLGFSSVYLIWMAWLARHLTVTDFQAIQPINQD